jgi:F0F1-type ATP synthase membrane subunit b/b'
MELKGALNKHQSETQDIINKEINELKMKIKNIKQEATHDMENFRKKNQTETQNTLEGHFSELEDKIKIKEKTEELLVKKLQNCERNMQ